MLMHILCGLKYRGTIIVNIVLLVRVSECYQVDRPGREEGD